MRSKGQDVSPAEKILTALGANFDTFTHVHPPRSVEEAALERGQEIRQIVRSILFRLSETEFIMILIAGDKQISWKELRHMVGRSRLTLASPEEVYAITGYKIGTVSPLGIPENIPVYIDQSVITQDRISIGSGTRGKAILLNTTTLLSVLPHALRCDLGVS